MAERIRLNPLGGTGFQAPKLPQPAMPGSQPVHMAARVPGATGLHSYLGHFAQENFLRAGHNTSGHWEQGAVKHPGVEKAKAKRNGISTHAQLEKDSHSRNATTRRRGVLGLTFERQAAARKGK